MVFPTLTVRENLVATAANRLGLKPEWTLQRIHALFRGSRSGRTSSRARFRAESSRMLAIGRALMTNPRLLILDEATEGLAPVIRDEIWACLAGLKREGLSILVIDKNLAALKKLADRHVVIEKGARSGRAMPQRWCRMRHACTQPSDCDEKRGSRSGKRSGLWMKINLRSTDCDVRRAFALSKS